LKEKYEQMERKLLDDKLLKPGYATVSEGYVNEGWKDTVLLMPGERLKLLVKVGDHTGLFAYHCHNLEHEDMGMMRNYKVVA
jgi:blue copper oxidase